MTPQTLLLRQIHPAFIQQGRVTSQAFRPTPKDEKMLSVYDGDLIQPEKSWQHFTASPKNQSAGVLGVTKAECDELCLPVASDAKTFAEHALIDFSQFDRKTTEKLSKQLRVRAEDRSWLYQAIA